MAVNSDTPLIKKLGIRENMRLHLVDVPDNYHGLLGSFPDGVVIAEDPPYDFIHFFVNTIAALENGLILMKNEIASDGMIWISWHKKSSDQYSELTEDFIRDTALPLGLVDVKVCSIDENWSGLKLVIRKIYRNKQD